MSAPTLSIKRIELTATAHRPPDIPMGVFVARLRDLGHAPLSINGDDTVTVAHVIEDV